LPIAGTASVAAPAVVTSGRWNAAAAAAAAAGAAAGVPFHGSCLWGRRQGCMAAPLRGTS
jgi:hypothetical protein